MAPDAQQCGLCWHHPVDVAIESAVVPVPSHELTFSLRTLFLFTTLCAVCACAAAVSPALGVALTAFSVPAVIRTGRVATNFQRVTTETMPAAELAVEFLISLVASVTIPAVTIIAGLFTAFFVWFIGTAVLMAGPVPTDGGVYRSFLVVAMWLDTLTGFAAGFYIGYRTYKMMSVIWECSAVFAPPQQAPRAEERTAHSRQSR
jgi:hypothetical protein